MGLAGADQRRRRCLKDSLTGGVPQHVRMPKDRQRPFCTLHLAITRATVSGGVDLTLAPSHREGYRAIARWSRGWRLELAQAGSEPEQQAAGLDGRALGEKERPAGLGGGDRVDHFAESVEHGTEALAGRDDLSDLDSRLPPAAGSRAQPQKALDQLLALQRRVRLAVEHVRRPQRAAQSPTVTLDLGALEQPATPPPGDEAGGSG